MTSNHVTFVALLLCVILSLGECKSSDRPSHRDHAGMARYLVHKANWTAMGTISSSSNFNGYPMVNVKSIADSALDEPSTGNIYFLLTNLDFTGKDVTKDNKLTALFTEEQNLSCTKNNVDPMEPTCARAIFTGKCKKLEKKTAEYKEADEAFTKRHPASIMWRSVHGFYFCKLEIEQIAVIDFYGGVHYVEANDYYKADYDSDNYAFDN